MDDIGIDDLRRFLRVSALIDGHRTQKDIAELLAKGEHKGEFELSAWHKRVCDRLWPQEADRRMTDKRKRLLDVTKQHPVRLTEEGRHFRDYARQVVQAACRFLDQLGIPAGGQLRIRSDRTAIERVLGKLLKDYLLDENGGGFRYIDIDGVDTGAEMADAILAGHADIAIWVDTPEYSPGGPLAREELLTFRRALITSQEYRATRPYAPDRDPLDEQVLLTFRPSDLFELRMDGRLPLPKGKGKRVYLPNSTHMLSWCQEGIGVAMGVVDAYPLPNVQSVRRDLFDDTEEVLFVYYPGAGVSSEVRRVIDHLLRAGREYRSDAAEGL